MHEPLYKPDFWVTYQQGETGGFGQIIGGVYDGETWHYTIKGSRVDGTHTSVRQDEFGYLFQNGSWLAPTGGASNESAYKDA